MTAFRPRALACSMLVTVLTSSGAAAQSTIPVPALDPYTTSVEFGRQNAQTIRDDDGENPTPPVFDGSAFAMSLVSTLGQSGVGRSRAEIDTSFKNDQSRTRQNLRSFVARTPNVEARADIERIIAARPALIQDIRQSIEPYGLGSHDVADAYAFWWINAWLVANKKDEDPSPETIAIVERQVRNTLASSPGFAMTGDADRQEYAEALLVQGTLLSSTFEQWKADPNMLDQLAEAARNGAIASGMDLSLMTLTRDGFVPREKADGS